MLLEPALPGEERQRLRQLAIGDRALDAFTVLSLGRLVPIKGTDDTIRASAALGCPLLVAGGGPERDALESLARTLGADTRFLGIVTGAAKRDLFAAADAFVLASRVLSSGRTEGTPTTLLEAMAAGLPIVATDVGGVAGVVTHERNGLLVPAGDLPALTAAIARLRDDAALRRSLTRAARNTAALYTWSALAPHLDALVRDA